MICTFCNSTDRPIVADSGREKLCRPCLDEAVETRRRVINYRLRKYQKRRQRTDAMIENLEIVK